MKNNYSLSIAIPTYNSSKYLASCISSVINFKVVDEIVVHDDNSDDLEFKKIKKIIDKYVDKINIKLYKNKKNYGAFINKYENIRKCSNDFVYQLDSDNISGPEIDNIFYKISKSNNKDFLYLPSKIYQFYNFPKAAMYASKVNKKYKVTYTKSDFVFTKDILNEAIKENSKFTVDKNINWILNSGNFIVHKKSYTEVMESEIDFNIRYPLDAVAISYFWIANGKNIKTLQNLYHFHRKRSNSVSFTENAGSYDSLQNFRNKFLEL